MIDGDIYARMERCATLAMNRPCDAAAKLGEALGDVAWPVRYAAAVALGDLGAAAASAVPSLLALLQREDAAPLYSQPEGLSGGPAGSNTPMGAPRTDADAARLDAWRRRGRIKQAAIWALSDIGQSTPAVLAFLHRYAVDQAEDYAVRAAACRALRTLGNAQSIPVLQKAAQDGEWCTSCEARTSLQVLNR